MALSQPSFVICVEGESQDRHELDALTKGITGSRNGATGLMILDASRFLLYDFSVVGP